MVCVLASCARSIPAPVVYGNKSTPPAATAQAQPRPAPNPLQRPTQLNPQSSLETQTAEETGPASATVANGETVYLFARRNRIAIRDLIEVNRLNPPYRLRAGQTLVIPSVRIHRVTKGDTLYGVSRSYGADMYTVASINLIEAPYIIRTGQKLRLPNRRLASAVSRTVAFPTVPSQTKAAKKSTASTTLTPPKASSGGRFTWPLRGRIISDYGAKPGGLHNDGINIAASAGAPVVAADTGVVAYAGNELRGFGNLLLLRHAGGWTSAYAHNDKLLVKRGDRVARGDVIAHVGATGRVARPQLHFELRKQSDAVNPLRFLAPLS